MRKKKSSSLAVFTICAMAAVAAGMFAGVLFALFIVGRNSDYQYTPALAIVDEAIFEYIPEPEVVYITWPFIAYTQPDFLAERRGSFAPQEITVLYENEGWVLISDQDKDHWVYTNANRIYIGRITGVFDDVGGKMVTRLYLQMVDAVERRGNWIKIDTHLGYKWIDLGFEPPTHEFEAFMRQFGNISVFYENMATGFIMSYNPYQEFFYAGVASELVTSRYEHYISANDAGIMLREIFSHVASGGWYEVGVNNAAIHSPFAEWQYPMVIKNGRSPAPDQAWHEMGIVYSQSPYSIAILSSRPGGYGDRRVYAQIAEFVREFNDKWFVSAAEEHEEYEEEPHYDE